MLKNSDVLTEKQIERSEMILALDTETTGIDLWHGARPFLVTTANEKGENTWWEWNVEPTTRTVRCHVDELREVFKLIKETDTLVLQNPKFDYIGLYLLASDYGELAKFLDAWDWRKVRDTLTYGHVLASNQPHDLTSMALLYLGVDIQPFEDKIVELTKEARRWATKERPGWMIAKAGLSCMPSAKEKVAKFDMWLPRAMADAIGDVTDDDKLYTACAEYANADSSTTMFLYKKQWELLEERGLLEIANAKLEVLPVLTQMEIDGVTYSDKRLKELSRKYANESYDCATVCYDIADSYGVELELPKGGVNKSLRSFVFDTLKMPIIKRGDGGNASLDKSVMMDYAASTDGNMAKFFNALMDKRSRDTAITYMDGYDRYGHRIHMRSGWRILHPNVNPNGSETLRFSSQYPNEQNISKKEGFNLRYAFGPLPGRVWFSIDYENLELKIPAYESGEEVMIEIFEKPNDPPYFGSYHLLNASIVYPDEFWPIADQRDFFKKKYKATLYQWIKNFGFAIQYGAQEATADRAAHKRGAFKAVKAKLQKIEALNRRCIDSANKLGYVETIPDKTINPSRGYQLLCRRSSLGSISPTLPLNYHVQGTACWIMLRAMVEVQSYLQRQWLPARIVMNIHDELVLDAPDVPLSYEMIKVVKKVMERQGDKVGIPLTCGLSVHKNNWSEE